MIKLYFLDYSPPDAAKVTDLINRVELADLAGINVSEPHLVQPQSAEVCVVTRIQNCTARVFGYMWAVYRRCPTLSPAPTPLEHSQCGLLEGQIDGDVFRYDNARTACSLGAVGFSHTSGSQECSKLSQSL